MNIPNKIFERNINDLTIGFSTIHLYKKDEIESVQTGYNINENKEIIKDSIGENFLIIGNDSCVGDPIVINLNDDKLPVYTIIHDDCDYLEIIADSFEDYMQMLTNIYNTDFSNKKDCKNLLKEIPDTGSKYWEALINSAFDY